MWVWVSVVVVTRNARGNNAQKCQGGLGEKMAGVLAARFEN